MELKKEMLNKWKLKYSCSEKTTSIQDIYTEVGKRNCHGEEDRGTFAVMNHLLSGHTLLNSHRAKMNSNVSELCETCSETEDTKPFPISLPEIHEKERTIGKQSGRNFEWGWN